MFKKVLLVEDIDSVGHGVAIKLQEIAHIKSVVLAQYCDEAYLKFRKAEQDEEPFELIVTDLSFRQDHRQRNITSGEQLILKLQDQGYKVPTIVYSVEERIAVIKRLLQYANVKAYVLKDRKGIQNMINAVASVKEGNTYTAPELANILRKKEVFTLQDYDISLLGMLSKGLTQEQISAIFRENGKSPSSLSSIEKRLNRLKEELRAKTTIQLVAQAKDLGLI